MKTKETMQTSYPDRGSYVHHVHHHRHHHNHHDTPKETEKKETAREGQKHHHHHHHHQKGHGSPKHHHNDHPPSGQVSVPRGNHEDAFPPPWVNFSDDLPPPQWLQSPNNSPPPPWFNSPDGMPPPWEFYAEEPPPPWVIAPDTFPPPWLLSPDEFPPPPWAFPPDDTPPPWVLSPDEMDPSATNSSDLPSSFSPNQQTSPRSHSPLSKHQPPEGAHRRNPSTNVSYDEDVPVEIPPWLFEPDYFGPWFDDFSPWYDHQPASYEETEKAIRRNRCITICFFIMITMLAAIFLACAILLFLLQKEDSSGAVDTTGDYGYGDYGNYGALDDSATTSGVSSGPQGWSEWTSADCSVSCGLGKITRRRTCSGPECEQPEETEDTECYQGACTCSFYVSNHLNIFQVDESGSVNPAYSTTGKQVSVDLSYDPLTKVLFWSNKLKQIVKNEEVITTVSYTLGGLIVDTKEKLIFVAAEKRGIISVNFKGENEKFVKKDPSMVCETLINLQLDGLLFWVNNKRSRVQSVKYDGSDSKILYKIPKSYGAVAGMTVDIATKTLYWQHRKGAKIFSLPHDGSSSPQQVFSGSSGFVGEDLVICKENLFYIDPGSGGGAIFKIGLDGKNRQKMSQSAIRKCDSLYLDN